MKKKEIAIEIKKARIYSDDKCIDVIDFSKREDRNLKLSELEHFRTKLVKELSKSYSAIDRINFWYEQASGE